MIEYVLWTIAFIALFLTIVWINIMYSHKEKKEQKSKTPLVSIAIPAFNEEEGIESTLESVVRLDYPENKLEIIIINDGSTDKTAQRIKNFIKKNPGSNIKLINKKNEGKAAALNTALEICKGELFACVDGDTTVDKDSLKNMMWRFQKKNTAAVISTIKVKNPDNMYGKIQRMEYLMAVLMRNLMTFTKTLHVTPGALSVYRTKILIKHGGFDKNNITEDFEIAMRLKSLDYDVELEKNSVVYTNVPSNINSFWRQRIRWSRGFIHNHVKYKHMVLNKKHGNMGMFQLPLNIIAPILLITSIVVIAYMSISKLYEFGIRSVLIKGYFQTHLLTFPSFKEMILGQNLKIVFPIIIGSILGIYLFYMAHKMNNEKIKNPGSTALYFLALPYMIASYWITAIIQEIMKIKKQW